MQRAETPVETAEPVRPTLPPPLKWAGGKRWLLPHLRPLWQPHRHRRLAEPFCGGLAVALGLNPERALLNDINPHAINFYRQLKAGLKVSIRMVNDSDHYYDSRTEFNRLIADNRAATKKAAALFYYLNRTGYNGLCRFNSRGEFNVPFGRYKTINYTRDFSAYRGILSEWAFSCGDFESMALSPEDFIYADPPYDVQFTQYAKENFRWEDQVRLAEWLARHPGPVVASNQATEKILELYRELGFEIDTLPAPRMISCTGDRSKALEMLATRNL
ncbi:DNA adenine methylase [Thioalbus denitrificans]|uniref:Site-specific DNA-methyltransferase (adenine-specific) n=1 Tax=Thioalbus denitrificans TaxID=547122 RepID=A0A369CGQ4_9GAMM|nr:Dam family site-specific DNA-(adenine-N6)-methyltransferase [Thioalbus denitrificans]RCX32873.1 DNA adenine methylase [Thioalbus denitrificans]